MDKNKELRNEACARKRGSESWSSCLVLKPWAAATRGHTAARPAVICVPLEERPSVSIRRKLLSSGSLCT